LNTLELIGDIGSLLALRSAAVSHQLEAIGARL
jgi:hypothetical protein